MTDDDPAYFLYHSIGLYPGKAEEMAGAFARFSRIWGAFDDGQWPAVLAERAVYLDLWRDLIGAPEGTVTSAENVTTALYSLVGSLPPDRLRGRRVLVGADCFPSLHFLLAGLADRMGFALDTVPIRAGSVHVDEGDMIDRWGPDVGLALLTFVTSTAGYRCDLDALAAHGRAMGTVVGVDLTQGIGIVPWKVTDQAPDFAVSTTLKWLCGTPGAGMLHVRADLLADCAPELRGWFSQDDPFRWDLDRFAFAPDARRFDHGTPSVLACIGSVPALRWHAGQDGEALLAHARRLGETIVDGVRELGLSPVSPTDPDRRGGSVMLSLPQKTDARALVAGLRAEGVHLDCRGAILRVSPGAVTHSEHVDRLLDGLRRHLGVGR